MMKIGKSEADKSAEDLLKCRQIVSEITSFGVTQNQMMQIIHLLALELENRDALVDITTIIKEYQENPLAEHKNKLLEV